MSQETFLEFLKGHPNRWYSATQMSQIMFKNRKYSAPLFTSLKKLRKTDFMEWKERTNSSRNSIFLYKYKK